MTVKITNEYVRKSAGTENTTPDSPEKKMKLTRMCCKTERIANNCLGMVSDQWSENRREGVGERR